MTYLLIGAGVLLALFAFWLGAQWLVSILFPCDPDLAQILRTVCP